MAKPKSYQLDWIQIPVILLFASAFVLTELSEHGRYRWLNPQNRAILWLQTLNHTLTDFKFRLRGSRPPQNKIVIVEVDSPSIDAFGRWPWHRDKMANLIDATFRHGAKVVGLDMVFSEPDPRVAPELLGYLPPKLHNDVILRFETDPKLAEMIARYSDHLVLGWASESGCVPLYAPKDECPVSLPEAIATLPDDLQRFAYNRFTFASGAQKSFDREQTPIDSFVTMIPNVPMFSRASKHQGYFSVTLDGDGRIRRTSLLMMGNGAPYPSLPLEMARIGKEEELEVTFDPSSRVQSLRFAKSNTPLPVTPLGAMQINFRGGERTFPYLSAVELLSPSDTVEGTISKNFAGQSKNDILKDAYVLIGVSALGVFDMRAFPFGSNVPGVEGHANILDNLLSGDAMRAPTERYPLVPILIAMTVFAFLLGTLARKLQAIPAVTCFFGILAALVFVDLKVLFNNGQDWHTGYLYLELCIVFASTIMLKYILEERDKKFLRSAFTKYVAPAVVDSILEDPTKLSLGGERRDMTVLFSDIRGFTTFSENMDAKELSAFLNDYLGIMTGIVFEHRGTLDKYIGDAVMAFWGAPLDQPDHAQNACKAAQHMLRALAENHERFKTQYKVDVRIGVGLNTGIVSVGNMGSTTNFEYTVIGDHVNLASRLEGLTKHYGVTALTSRFTIDNIQKAKGEVPPHRVLDEVKVKGKKNAIELIEVLEAPLLPREFGDLYQKGRILYAQRDWAHAIRTFENALELRPKDGPSRLFIDRCRDLEKSPPPLDWDGSWEMDSK